MNCLAERIVGDFPEFGFSIDESVTRIREHSLSLDRCKRFTEIPRISFERNLTPLEWAVFAYYYSLAPNDHPSELSASTHLKIGRNTLAATLDTLASKGMVFFDTHARTKLRIVNVSHPEYWNRNPNEKAAELWINPATHEPRSFSILPNRVNDAKDFAHAPGQHVRLPYLLFHTLIHPTSKFLYGLLCYLRITTHPTANQLAGILRCSAPTVALRIAELEGYRMIYAEAREPMNFGEHTRYYYHLTDVAFWKTRKAKLWYPGGENSLIVRLDNAGFAGSRNIPLLAETDDFRPYADASQFFARPEPRQESSQIRQESSEVRQITSQVRQVMPQIRRDVESSQAMLLVTPEHGQETTQIRQVMPQIRQEVIRQVTSQIRQIRTQRRQIRFQIRQIRTQRRQIRSQSSEKHACNPYTERRSEDSSFAKNTYIRINNSKNTDRKELRARERWAPDDVSFHPRLINIAQAAASAWRERDYKCDRALWNGTVEKIAVERGEDEAVRFVSYVKSAHRAYGREFPYSPQLMQQFLDTFRAGTSWSSILGPGYEETPKTEAAREVGNPECCPGSQNRLLVGLDPLTRVEPNPGQMESVRTDSGVTESGSGLIDSMAPTITVEPQPPVVAVVAPEPQMPLAADIAPAETKPEPSAGLKKPGPVQLTHANLLDFPARSTTHTSAAGAGKVQEPATPKATIEPSPRRLQLEKAIATITFEMKSQSRESLKRGFAKLDDNALYENLCLLFGKERISSILYV